MGITFPQYLVLVTLWDEDDRTVSQIGQKLQLDSNTLTPLLKRMEAMGLVVRTRDAADERQVRLRLTGAGRDFQARAGEFVDCVVSKTGLSVEELTSLQARITLLRDRLRGRCDPEPDAAF
nr:MarR family transcriptional regulator [Frigidibacter oleivorans]